MNMFWKKLKNLDEREEELRNEEIRFAKKAKDNELGTYKLKVDKEIKFYQETNQFDQHKREFEQDKKVFEKEKEVNKQLAEGEHDFHYTKEKKNVELAKLDAMIEHKTELFDATKDLKQEEIVILKDVHKQLVEGKDNMIELLTDQVKILTAKLTEIKITDVSLNVSGVQREKKE